MPDFSFEDKFTSYKPGFGSVDWNFNVDASGQLYKPPPINQPPQAKSVQELTLELLQKQQALNQAVQNRNRIDNIYQRVMNEAPSRNIELLPQENPAQAYDPTRTRVRNITSLDEKQGIADLLEEQLKRPQRPTLATLRSTPTTSGARINPLIDITATPIPASPRSSLVAPSSPMTARPNTLPTSAGRLVMPVAGGLIDFGLRIVSGQSVSQAISGTAASTAGALAGAAIGSSVGPIGAFVGGIVGGLAGGFISDTLFNNARPKAADLTPEPKGYYPFYGGQGMGIQYQVTIQEADTNNPFSDNRTIRLEGPIRNFYYLPNKNGAGYNDIFIEYGDNKTIRFDNTARNFAPRIIEIRRTDGRADTDGNVKPYILADNRTLESIQHPGNQNYAPPKAFLGAGNDSLPTHYAPGGIPEGGNARGDKSNWVPHGGLAPKSSSNPANGYSNLGGNFPTGNTIPPIPPIPPEQRAPEQRAPEQPTPEQPTPGEEMPSSFLDSETKKYLDIINAKLDSVLPVIPLIIAKPNPLTAQETIEATKEGVCKTTQPGGCMNNALKDSENNIKNNANTNTANVLDAINTGANAAQLALLRTIDNKLGPQLPGGMSDFLTKFLQRFNKVAEWLHLDRVLNVLIWWQTLHNAYMLSNNLGQTLTSAISNILSIIGIKDAEGNALDIGEIIGKTFDNAAKTALGETTWGGMKTEWKRYNRIYQAGANILNSVQSIGHSILGALEVVGSWNASIGNALRKWGTVGENAYRWMNPTPNFQNRFFVGLESATGSIPNVQK